MSDEPRQQRRRGQQQREQQRESQPRGSRSSRRGGAGESDDDDDGQAIPLEPVERHDDAAGSRDVSHRPAGAARPPGHASSRRRPPPADAAAAVEPGGGGGDVDSGESVPPAPAAAAPADAGVLGAGVRDRRAPVGSMTMTRAGSSLSGRGPGPAVVGGAAAPIGDDHQQPLHRGELRPTASFALVIHGQLESCEIVGAGDLYCKYDFVYGDDWSIVSGDPAGMTQVGGRAVGASGNAAVVWNFPLEVSFRSTNAFGWPQLVLAVYGKDWAGRDVVGGYGTTYLPLAPGRYERHVKLFTPMSISAVKEFVGLLTGERTEFLDPKFIAKPEGRKVTRASSKGSLKLVMNVITKGLSAFGYTEAGIAPSRPIVY